MNLLKRAYIAAGVMVTTFLITVVFNLFAENFEFSTFTNVAIECSFGLLSMGALMFLMLGVISSEKRTKLVSGRVEKLQSLCITNLGRANEALAKGDLKFEIVTGTEKLHDPNNDTIGDLSRSVDGIITRTQETVAQFEKSRAIILEVINEISKLTAFIDKGNLTSRGDIKRFEGGFKDLIKGVNGTVEAFVMPLEEIAEVLERIADRDLTAQMKGNYRGDFAKIKDSVNRAAQNLDEGFQQVSVSAEQVASAAGQISGGSQSLAQGASEQASTIEEVSSSLQEISSMTRQNATNSMEARSLSDNARTSTERGMHSMEQLSNAISKIKDSSDSTAKIVKTIEEIAFQTNLLALNAAVEAARAGDAGKGFAVVAEEVRNLAIRSAEAAKSTSQLIDESAKNTDEGVSLNSEVSRNLAEINEQIEKVSVVVAEIAAASDQQSQGVSQINIAIEQMNSVTQQTAANSEESASAAEELSSQSQEMLGLISQYKLTKMQRNYALNNHNYNKYNGSHPKIYKDSLMSSMKSNKMKSTSNYETFIEYDEPDNNLFTEF